MDFSPIFNKICDAIKKGLSLLSWNFLIPVFFVSIVLLLFDYFGAISILNPMLEKYKEIIAWICFLSGIGIFYMLCCAVFMACRMKFLAWRESVRRENQRFEEQKQNKREIEYALSLLTPAEISLFRFVWDYPQNVVWLPFRSSATLSLCSKGCLEFVSNWTEARGVDFNLVPCAACCIPLKIREYIDARKTEFQEKWSNIPTRDMNQYQEEL